MRDIIERTYGTVAENKTLGTNTIFVWLSQKTPWLQGDLQSQLQSVKTEFVDASGNKFSSTTNTDTVIEAQWQGPDSSWVTAPDVQRGEIVEIFRYADSSTYYWRERGDGNVKRRLETKRMMVSGSTTAGEPDPSTHYMIEVSGHTGAINISTPKSNGEVTTYSFTLNGKGGMASLSDGEGNEVILDSKNKIVRLRNSEGSLVELNEQDIAHYCLGNMGFYAKDTMKFVAGKSIVMETLDIYFNARLHLNGPIMQDAGTSESFDAVFRGEVKSLVNFSVGPVKLVGHVHFGVQRGGDPTDVASAP